ncbi:endosomal/lysosomal proton channel TMEM175-like [Hydra vulgaris]|uniref:Endosomal/lysosomal proton channel TMEM175 n=1 Tax=Hydra vulgaris TaxID=6087 RepID=A0ABM4DKP6_HYDVU
MVSENESFSKTTNSTNFDENLDESLIQKNNLTKSEPKIFLRLFKKRKVLSEDQNEVSMALVNYKNKLKHLEEHYDIHVNDIMPDLLHRGDIVSPQRMLGYVDAMMATCATFLVIPLRKIKDISPNHFLGDHLYENRTEFIMFLLGYLVVLTIWESINIRSLLIKRVDDILLFMTMFTMFLTSLLPFSLSLEGHYPGETISVWITCSLLALIELTDLCVLFYSMEHPSILHVELHTWTKVERRRFRNMLCLQNIFNIVFFIMGSLFILLNHVLAWVFIAMIILMPPFKKLFFYIRRHTVSQTKIEKSPFFFHFTKGNISIERVTAMSDAAFAIIACILILDITIDEFPTYQNVLNHGLTYELMHMKKDFFIYFGIFAIISTLWYSNHGVLHLFKSTNVIIVYLQKISLALACLTPLAGNMVVVYATNQNRDAKKSILVTSLVIFFSSTFNLIILIYGLYTKEKYLHCWAVGNMKKNKYQQIYTVLKAANFPFWSFLCTLGSRMPVSIIFYIMCGCFCCSIATFIGLKLIFDRLIGKKKFLLRKITDPKIPKNSEDIPTNSENAKNED